VANSVADSLGEMKWPDVCSRIYSFGWKF